MRGGANQHLLSADGEADNGGEIEIAPSGDRDYDQSPKAVTKRQGKTKVTFKSKSGPPGRQHSTNGATSSSSSVRGDEFHDMEL